MTVIVTSGEKSEEFSISLNLVDPCHTVDLGQQPSPFVDVTYSLQDPSEEQVWQISQLIDP